MSRYPVNRSKMMENADFLEFLKTEYKGVDAASLPDYELEALIYKFKIKKDDIDKQDAEFLQQLEKQNSKKKREELASVYYPNIRYDAIAPWDKAFVNVVEWHTEDLRLSAENVKQKSGLTLKNAAQTDTNSTAVENRLRSDHNLQEDNKLAKLRMEALLEVKTIIKAEFDNNIGGFEPTAKIEESRKSWEFLENSEENVKDIKQYKQVLANKLLDNNQERVLTPELACEAHEVLTQQVKDEPKNTEAQAKLAKTVNVMNNLADDFIQKRGYFLLDITNVADAYDGYNRMFNLRLKQLDEQKKKLTKAAKKDEQSAQLLQVVENNIKTYENCLKDLDTLMKPYDERWNIPDGKNPYNSAVKMNDRARQCVKVLDNIKPDKQTLGAETLQMLSRFKFKGTEGNLPQFYDPKNPDTKSDTWREGLEVIPNSRLATVLQLVKNDILMTELNADDKISKEELTEKFKNGIGEKLFAIYNSEEKIAGIAENPRKFVQPEKEKYLTEFMNKLNNPEVPLAISDTGYIAAMEVQANNAEVYCNRVSKKIGANNSEFIRGVITDQMQQIDRRAPLHNAANNVRRQSLRRNLFGTALGAGLAYTGARVFTNIAATGGASLAVSTTAATITAVGVGIGVTTLQYIAKRKEAKANGDRHYNLKKFLKDKKVLAAIGASTLGAAAVVFAKVNAPETLVAGAAIGSFGLGVGLRFAQPYKDMRLKGHSRLSALAMGACSAAATLGAGMLGRTHALNNISPTERLVPDGQKPEITHSKSYDDAINAKAETWNNSDGIHHGARYTPDGLQPSESLYHKSGNYDTILKNVQDSMTDWEPDAAKTNLAKLENAVRLGSPDTLVKDGSGRTLGDVMGYVNPDTGNRTTYSDVMQHLLNNPSAPLNKDEAQVMEQVALHIGAGNGNKMGHLIPDVGIRSEDLYSYDTTRPHGIIDKVHVVMVDVYKTVYDYATALCGIVGWAHRDGGAKNRFRPGAKADRVVIKQKPTKKPVNIVHDEPKPVLVVAPIKKPEPPVNKPEPQEEKPVVFIAPIKKPEPPVNKPEPQDTPQPQEVKPLQKEGKQVRRHYPLPDDLSSVNKHIQKAIDMVRSEQYESFEAMQADKENFGKLPKYAKDTARILFASSHNGTEWDTEKKKAEFAKQIVRKAEGSAKAGLNKLSVYKDIKHR